MARCRALPPARSAAVTRAPGSAVTSAGGVAGPHLAARVGGARTRLRTLFPPLTHPARRDPQAPAAQPPATGEAGPPLQDRLRQLLRRHWVISVLVAAGLLLRAAAALAYLPALIYVDSLKYLYGASPGADPLGYKAVLLGLGNLTAVALLQHLVGLATGILIYAVVLRRGAARWLAALAAAPVLLDAYQLQMEQTIMPDVWFDAMIVAGLAVLLWRPSLTVPFVIAAGLILGSSATVQATGEILIAPALVYVLAAAGGWRRRIEMGGALFVAFALPILCYCSISYVTTGHFWLARGQANSGRLAAAADCATLKLPAAVRPLCPTPGEQAHGPDWLEHTAVSPLHAAAIPPGANRAALINTLDSAVEHQQPLRVAAAIARDSVRLFALTRDPIESVTPISRWQFQTGYPAYPPWVTLGRRHAIIVGVQEQAFTAFRFRPLGRAQVDRPVAAFLRSYQLNGGYTPGPLLLLFTLAGVAGSVLALVRRTGTPRGRQLALACLLFTAAAATVLLVPDVLEFSWRYQLPALVTLPPAGVLGFSAMLSGRRAQKESSDERVIATSDVAWVPGPAS
jgi:hypothetical protein